jgi:hypothetical protein
MSTPCTRSKHGFSKLCTPPMRTFLSAHQPATARPSVPNLRLWGIAQSIRAVCIEPYQEMVDLRVKDWKSRRLRSQGLKGGKEIVSLTDDTDADHRLLRFVFL